MHRSLISGSCICALTNRAFLHILSAMQQVAPEVIALEKDANDHGVVMAHVLAAAEVVPSTWFRWRNKGIEPRMATFRKVRHELDRLIAANDAIAQERAA